MTQIMTEEEVRTALEIAKRHLIVQIRELTARLENVEADLEGLDK